MKLALVIATALVSGSLAMAADAENKSETTVDTSKNPITGTVTKKTKHKKKVKGEHGSANVEVTEKTKTHKDGKVEHSTEVDSKTKTEEAPKH